MTFWLVIAILYVLNIAFFRWIGGAGSAGDAIRRWGHSAAGRRPHGSSS